MCLVSGGGGWEVHAHRARCAFCRREGLAQLGAGAARQQGGGRDQDRRWVARTAGKLSRV